MSQAVAKNQNLKKRIESSRISSMAFDMFPDVNLKKRIERAIIPPKYFAMAPARESQKED